MSVHDSEIFVPVFLLSILFSLLSFVLVAITKILRNKNEKALGNIIIEKGNQKDANKKDTVIKVSENDFTKVLYSHHMQALWQSTVQFWFSLIASIIGFVFIIYMIISIEAKDIQWYNYLLRTLPGVVIEAVSVLFFNQSRSIRDRATDFFRELNYQQQIDKSVEIISAIDDNAIKSRVKADISLHIVGIKTKYYDN